MEKQRSIDLASLSPFIMEDFRQKKNSFFSYQTMVTIEELTSDRGGGWFAEEITCEMYDYETLAEAQEDFNNLTDEDKLKTYITRQMDIYVDSALVNVALLGKPDEYSYPDILMSQYVILSWS